MTEEEKWLEIFDDGTYLKDITVEQLAKGLAEQGFTVEEYERRQEEIDQKYKSTFGLAPKSCLIIFREEEGLRFKWNDMP